MSYFVAYSAFLFAPIAAFAFCGAAVWFMLRSGLALRLALDEPNARSLHTASVPRVGGLALVPVVAAAWWWLDVAPLLLLLMLALAAISYVDDRRGLPVALRFGAHVGAAVAFVWNTHSDATWWYVLPIVVGMVWMINLYNFMDGSDGLAGGMALFGFFGYGVAASISGATQLAEMSFTVASASLAFLCFNYHPARLFLGDVGSITIGFLAAALGLQGWVTGLWPWWFPPLVFLPFVADATVTLLRRLLRGEKVWQAHREHYYQRLVRMGWGHRRTALVEYCLMAASGGSALALLHASSRVQVAALILWCALLAALMLIIDRRWRAHVAATEVTA